jgi:hypothetical protein
MHIICLLDTMEHQGLIVLTDIAESSEFHKRLFYHLLGGILCDGFGHHCPKSPFDSAFRHGFGLCLGGLCGFGGALVTV